MKKTISLCLFMAAWTFLCAQKPDPVHWRYTANKIDNQTYELHLTATIDEPWHIYAQVQPKEAIAIPTKITFEKDSLVIISGISKENGKKEKYEDAGAGILQYLYSGTLDFTQTVILKKNGPVTVSGHITYQACKEELCLPPKTIAFKVAIP